jgi:methionyl-tRNA synthetase
MDDALQLLPADDWRWYLLANAPESDDSSFTWELFAGAVNKDLADNLGNFVNRTLTFTSAPLQRGDPCRAALRSA